MDAYIPRDVVGDVSVCHLTQLIACMQLRRQQGMPFTSIFDNLGTDDLLLAGSCAEQFSETASSFLPAHNDPTGNPASDIDVLFFHECPCKIGPQEDPETHLVIDTSDTEPGYLRLEHVPTVQCEKRQFSTDYVEKSIGPGYSKESRTYLYNIRSQVQDYEDMTKELSPILSTLRDTFDEQDMSHLPIILKKAWGDTLVKPLSVHTSSFVLSGPALNAQLSMHDESSAEKYMAFDIDLTNAVKCSLWPSVAEKWLTRKRPSGWLSSQMIQNIKDQGCYFVQVAHWNSLCPDIEWRFSFTYGEKTLAHHLTETQRSCYVTFKTIIKVVLHPNTTVRSYCLKNVLFWTLDKIPRDVWENPWTGLGTCFLALLDELIHCLANHNLPQYFIPENNLIGHKPRYMIRTALKELVQIRQNLIQELVAFDKEHPPIHAIAWERLEVCKAFIETGFAHKQLVNFIDDFVKLSIRRLWQLVQKRLDIHVGVTKAFSQILNHVRLIGSRALSKCLMFPSYLLSIDKIDEVTTHRCIKYSWYCFIYLCHNDDRLEHKKMMSLVLQTFQLKIQLKSWSPQLKMYHYTRFALVMHKLQRHNLAIFGARAVTTLSSLDELSYPLDEDVTEWCVLQKHSAVAFHASLQSLTIPATLSQFLCIPSKCVAYHTSFHCYLELNMVDKARDILRLFEDYCQKLVNLESNQKQAMGRTSALYILAMDQQKIENYSDATATYSKIQEMPGSSLIECEKDRLHCFEQHNQMLD